MLVDLDTNELWYLLEGCLHGSHLRSGTIERFVNEFYDKLSEHQRMDLFEWAVRLGYAWNGNRCFSPSGSCCGKDTIFMKRYHPLNQYIVTMSYKVKTPGGRWRVKIEKVRAFLMEGSFYKDGKWRCDPAFITNVEHLDFKSLWDEHKVDGVDYDTNILEPCPSA